MLVYYERRGLAALLGPVYTIRTTNGATVADNPCALSDTPVFLSVRYY